MDFAPESGRNQSYDDPTDFLFYKELRCFFTGHSPCTISNRIQNDDRWRNSLLDIFCPQAKGLPVLEFSLVLSCQTCRATSFADPTRGKQQWTRSTKLWIRGISSQNVKILQPLPRPACKSCWWGNNAREIHCPVFDCSKSNPIGNSNKLSFFEAWYQALLLALLRI